MVSRWDAIIVGGGPAGASLSVLLSREGWRVALLDQAQFPRQKVCGEFLGSSMWPLLDKLGVAGEVQRLALPIEMLELVLPGGRRLLARLPGENTRGAAALSRWALDTLLLDEARRAGVEVLLHRHVGKVLIDKGRASGVQFSGALGAGGRDELRAPLIVAADGRRSTVVRQTGSLQIRPTGLIGFKRHWIRDEREPSPTVLEMHAHRRGYVGICPVEQGVINVCGLMPAEWVKRTRGSIDAALLQWGFEPGGSAQLQGAMPRDAWQTTSEVTCQSAAPGVAGVLYVGDAQGTIEPVAGQGMTLALGSAALAASLLAEAGPEGVDGALQTRYQASWEAAFSRPAGTSRRLGWLLRHPALLRGVVPLFDVAPAVQRYLLGRAFRAMRVELAPMVG